jgi:hypothetical protein
VAFELESREISEVLERRLSFFFLSFLSYGRLDHHPQTPPKKETPVLVDLPNGDSKWIPHLET